ncbi:hypothetical protein K0M31_014907, partial [Melipona bicolor]
MALSLGREVTAQLDSAALPKTLRKHWPEGARPPFCISSPPFGGIIAKEIRNRNLQPRRLLFARNVCYYPRLAELCHCTCNYIRRGMQRRLQRPSPSPRPEARGPSSSPSLSPQRFDFDFDGKEDRKEEDRRVDDATHFWEEQLKESKNA